MRRLSVCIIIALLWGCGGSDGSSGECPPEEYEECKSLEEKQRDYDEARNEATERNRNEIDPSSDETYACDEGGPAYCTSSEWESTESSGADCCFWDVVGYDGEKYRTVDVIGEPRVRCVCYTEPGDTDV